MPYSANDNLLLRLDNGFLDEHQFVPIWLGAKVPGVKAQYIYVIQPQTVRFSTFTRMTSYTQLRIALPWFSSVEESKAVALYRSKDELNAATASTNDTNVVQVASQASVLHLVYVEGLAGVNGGREVFTAKSASSTLAPFDNQPMPKLYVVKLYRPRNKAQAFKLQDRNTRDRKILKMQEERDTILDEARFYNSTLKSLQGKLVPKYYGMFNGEDDRGLDVVCFVTEFIQGERTSYHGDLADSDK